MHAVTLELEQRSGWPDELKGLLTQYPRNTWSSHPHASMAQFWLERHNMFRHHAAELVAATEDWLSGKRPVTDYRYWLAPRLQAFISHLHGHHQIEDHHYFPAFRAAESKLARGFDVLDRDHQTLHDSIVQLVETTNAFLTAVDDEALKRSGEHCANAIITLNIRLCRHLEDEEDLIIPVMLHHRTG